MKFILTNLFTTLYCQRNTIRDESFSNLPLSLEKREWGTNLVLKIGIFYDIHNNLYPELVDKYGKRIYI